MVIFAHPVDILPHTPTGTPEHNKCASFGLQNQIAYASTGHPNLFTGTEFTSDSDSLNSCLCRG